MASIKIDKKNQLNAQQELFCKYYVSEEFFANGTQSYAKAYKMDLGDPGMVKAASASASRLLVNVKICRRISELLDLGGFNAEFADKQLLFLMTQNQDLATKRASVADFNKLKQRITEKSEITHKGLVINLGGSPDPDYLEKRKANNK